MTDDLITDLPPIVAPDFKLQPEPQLSLLAALVQLQQTEELAKLAKVDLKAVALAQFGDWRGDIAKARKTLDGAVHDVSTVTKLAETKSLRQRLINAPRAEVRKVAKAVKARLAAVSKDVGATEEAAVIGWDAVETLITPQIEAAEKKLEDERLERERLAAVRQQQIEDELAEISGFLARAQGAEGMTADRVGKGIELLGALTFGADDWTDPVAAATLQRQTIEGMLQLQAKLAAEEAASARIEAQRLENERLAASLAAQQAALDAQAATLRAEQARIKGHQARIVEIHAAATGHENATAADLYEAMVAVTALDVSEAQYQEYTALAMAAQDATLAKLQDLHFKAVEREDTEAAQRAAATATAVTTSAGPADALASQGSLVLQALAADPAVSPHTREAAAALLETEPMPQPGVAPQDHPLPEADAAPGMGTADAAIYSHVPGPAPVFAGASDEYGVIVVDAKPFAASHFYDTQEQAATDPRDGFIALVMTAFDCKFPSHPKPSQEWWLKVRAAGQALQQQAAA